MTAAGLSVSSPTIRNLKWPGKSTRASIAWCIGAGAVPALMPLIARDLIDGGAIIYGLLLGALGLGTVGGAICRTPLRSRLSNEAVVRAASAALALGEVVSAISPYMLVTLPALGLAGPGLVLALSTFNVSVQLA